MLCKHEPAGLGLASKNKSCSVAVFASMAQPSCYVWGKTQIAVQHASFKKPSIMCTTTKSSHQVKESFFRASDCGCWRVMLSQLRQSVSCRNVTREKIIVSVAGICACLDRSLQLNQLQLRCGLNARLSHKLVSCTWPHLSVAACGTNIM